MRFCSIAYFVGLTTFTGWINPAAAIGYFLFGALSGNFGVAVPTIIGILATLAGGFTAGKLSNYLNK